MPPQILGRPPSPLTVFAPSDAAIAALLAANGSSLAALLRDPARCDAVVGAHVVGGAALWLWDLMEVGA